MRVYPCINNMFGRTIICDFYAKSCNSFVLKINILRNELANLMPILGSISVYKRIPAFMINFICKKKKKKKPRRVDIQGILLFLEKIKEYLLLIKPYSNQIFDFLTTSKSSFITTTTYQLKQLNSFILSLKFRLECFFFAGSKKNNIC